MTRGGTTPALRGLSARRSGELALAAYRVWIASTIADADRHEPGFAAGVRARRAQHERIASADPEVRHRLHHRYASLEHALAAPVSADLRQASDLVTPRFVARSAVTGLRALVERAGTQRARPCPSTHC